ncbi:phosphate ABC transporter substrate-binding protein PstS [Gryllotalpicola protaetiae]|uniref:Phosphate-binding protein n=1 Tax=Gryllotalpicola protaetiae TaxID=2419771 RepID=A0A387BPH5_9MICO|nr:phosphate ABC transporter substrate-binding protein PstS [Gryllotalpicola protaetiae]AYG02856.1 phosphate ABC transporter substrate-binding protein PstS [Gryllotalpicola protaetiae]
MKLKNVAAAGALALATALALSACGSNDNGSSPSDTSTKSPAAAGPTIDPSLSGTITAGGSSAQANAQKAWTAAFTAQAAGVKINYDGSQGSGGGVTNWLGGSYDFAGTDSALSSDQFTQAQTTCGADGGLNIPVYLSGVAVIYKLPNDPKVNLSGSVIAQIFNGKITNWNDQAIAALNSGTTLPNLPISVVHRSDGSGTTNNFTNYLNQIAPSDWTTPANNAWPNSVGSGQQGGSGVVNTVEAGSGTIGYADQSSIGSATKASIQAGTSGSTFVAYSAAAATKAFDSAAKDAAQGTGDLTKKLDYTAITGADEYPIPLLSYDVLCKSFKDSTQGKLTAAYIGFIGSKVGQEVGEKNAGAAALPESIQTEIAKTIALVK